MSIIADSLGKNAASADAGKDMEGKKEVNKGKQIYISAPAKQAVSLPVMLLLIACAVILSGAGSWFLFHSLKTDIDLQLSSLEDDIGSRQATINAKISDLDKKLNAAGEKIEKLFVQNENNAGDLKAGTLAIAEVRKQLAELSSAISENKKAQDASVGELNSKLEKISLLQEKPEKKETAAPLSFK